MVFGLAVLAANAKADRIANYAYIPGDTLEKAPDNWFHLDPKADEINGVSSIKAYQELLKGKKSNTVIVAVIDSGIDIDHEDLKNVIWVNEDEVAGNGIDDDKNGYVDDIHGWNFIGGADGNVEKDTYEITREYGRLLKKFKGLSEEDMKADKEYAYFKKLEQEYTKTVSDLESKYNNFRGFYENYKLAKKLMEAYVGTENLTPEDLQSVNSSDEKVNAAKQMMKYIYDSGIDEAEFDKGNDYFDAGLNYGYNLSYNPRDIIGDNYEDPDDRYYGNNNVKGEFNFHGTHVAGIIAAQRDNSLGINGIADNVKVMAIRAVPNGDERDKDIANSIRYAVDNGAQIINMSFGKSYSPYKDAVDEAVNYAEKNNVLLIHAAGNNSKDIDIKEHFPTRTYSSGKKAGNWLEIGALSWKNGKESVATFSNYGKNEVDVFAPGVDIYSTAPEQEYKNASGTSMAAPVTAGVAAMLLSYFPTLTSKQVRDIIVQSSLKYDKLKVLKPGSENEEVLFTELSRTGGMINAFEAVKLASKVVKNKKKLKAY